MVRRNDGIIGEKISKEPTLPLPTEILDNFAYSEDKSVTHVLNQIYEPIEGAFPDGVVILAGDPLPDVSAEEMQQIISLITTTQELVNAYVNVHNKFWFIEDDLYDYDEGTDEYEKIRAVVDAWDNVMDADGG